MDNLGVLDDPHEGGKALVGDQGGFLRYRIGDYRIICSLDETAYVILVLKVGYRRDVYA